jgi:hypothetical protein
MDYATFKGISAKAKILGKESFYFIMHPLTGMRSRSKMILRRLGGGDEAYLTYVEEADNAANKNSALI